MFRLVATWKTSLRENDSECTDCLTYKSGRYGNRFRWGSHSWSSGCCNAKLVPVAMLLCAAWVPFQSQQTLKFAKERVQGFRICAVWPQNFRERSKNICSIDDKTHTVWIFGDNPWEYLYLLILNCKFLQFLQSGFYSLGGTQPSIFYINCAAEPRL